MTSSQHRTTAHCTKCGKATDHIEHSQGHERDSSGDYRECLWCNTRIYDNLCGASNVVHESPVDDRLQEKIAEVLARMGLDKDCDEARRISGAVAFVFDDWSSDRDPKNNDRYMD